jgi:hypothetical protein
LTSENNVNGTVVQLEAGEVIIRAGKGNHFVGRLSDTGQLILTNRRIIFKPHRINVFNKAGAWRVSDIRGISTGRVPTEVTLLLADDSKERFAVWHRSRWVQEIEAARGAYE